MSACNAYRTKRQCMELLPENDEDDPVHHKHHTDRNTLVALPAFPASLVIFPIGCNSSFFQLNPDGSFLAIKCRHPRAGLSRE